MPASLYDAKAADYAAARRPDPRLAASIAQALSGFASVVNVGAGTGSYEPAGGMEVIAVEPSAAMRAQRPPHAAPCLEGVAEQLPLADASVEVAMTVNSDLHWRDRRRGIAEMVRVSRRRVVIVTVDGEVAARHWLVRDYLPEAGDLFAPISAVTGAFPSACRVYPILIPADCLDGSVLAFWRRPEAFLDRDLTGAMAALTRVPAPRRERALARLAEDLRSGAWRRRYGDLLTLDALDLGQRLVVWDHPAPSEAGVRGEATGASSSPAG